MAESEGTPIVPSSELLEWPKKDMHMFINVVSRVGDLVRTIKFYTEGFGMKLLRKRDIPKEKNANTFLGFGPEEPQPHAPRGKTVVSDEESKSHVYGPTTQYVFRDEAEFLFTSTTEFVVTPHKSYLSYNLHREVKECELDLDWRSDWEKKLTPKQMDNLQKIHARWACVGMAPKIPRYFGPNLTSERIVPIVLEGNVTEPPSRHGARSILPPTKIVHALRVPSPKRVKASSRVVLVLFVEEVASEVATEVDEDVEGNFSIETGILKVITHLVVVRILEAEEEADFNEIGHLGFSGLKLFSKTKMVDGFPKINEPEKLFEACIKGKQHKQSFLVGKLWRARRPLEIIHTDIVGPFDIPSLGERKNRTILDMARSMVKAKHLPRIFGPKPFLCAVYLLNQYPTKIIRNKTPNEAWSGSKPSVGYFGIFHVPDQKRKKLDDKGEKCIFTGYDKRSKTYSFHNPLTKNLIISRDIEFDESDYWRWSEEERKVVGLFFNEDDNDGDDSNIEDDGDDDLTPPQSLTQQTPASIP
ncbi:hypothetical protein AgCh_001681 [Apium graveolens]